MASSALELFPDHLVLCVSALQWNNAILDGVFSLATMNKYDTYLNIQTYNFQHNNFRQKLGFFFIIQER